MYPHNRAIVISDSNIQQTISLLGEKLDECKRKGCFEGTWFSRYNHVDNIQELCIVLGNTNRLIWVRGSSSSSRRQFVNWQPLESPIFTTKLPADVSTDPQTLKEVWSFIHHAFFGMCKKIRTRQLDITLLYFYLALKCDVPILEALSLYWPPRLKNIKTNTWV